MKAIFIVGYVVLASKSESISDLYFFVVVMLFFSRLHRRERVTQAIHSAPRNVSCQILA
jgi:hypothetical protein